MDIFLVWFGPLNSKNIYHLNTSEGYFDENINDYISKFPLDSYISSIDKVKLIETLIPDISLKNKGLGILRNLKELLNYPDFGNALSTKN